MGFIKQQMQQDLSEKAEAKVDVKLCALAELSGQEWLTLPGICIDNQAIPIKDYTVST